MHKPRVDFLSLAVKPLWGDELRPCRRAASTLQPRLPVPVTSLNLAVCVLLSGAGCFHLLGGLRAGLHRLPLTDES